MYSQTKHIPFFDNKSPLTAVLKLLLVYAFVFNPWIKFPYTFVIIMIAILLLTYLETGSLEAIGLKKNIGIIKVIGLAFLAFLIVEPVLDFIIQPLINKITNDIPDYSTFDRVKNNLPRYCKYLFFIWISAAFGEEFLFRGFMFRQLSIIIPDCKFKKLFIILITSVLFSLPHLYLGLGGLIMTFIFGVVFAFLFIKYNYNIWILIVLHGLVDTLFITLAYVDKLSYYEIGNRFLFGY